METFDRMDEFLDDIRNADENSSLREPGFSCGNNVNIVYGLFTN